jgi:hypothetical protein
MYGSYEDYGERGHLDEKRNNPAYLNHYKNYQPGMDREKRDAQ